MFGFGHICARKTNHIFEEYSVKQTWKWNQHRFNWRAWRENANLVFFLLKIMSGLKYSSHANLRLMFCPNNQLRMLYVFVTFQNFWFTSFRVTNSFIVPLVFFGLEKSWIRKLLFFCTKNILSPSKFVIMLIIYVYLDNNFVLM